MATNQIGFYQEVIDIIVNRMNQTLTPIELRLAKEHPKMFVELAGEPKQKIVESNSKLFNVVLLDPGPMKISCIKTVRKITGLGLKEAKDLIDSVPSKIVEGIDMDRAGEIVFDLTEDGATARAVQQ